jgi:uncharacterized membrane protein YgcG
MSGSEIMVDPDLGTVVLNDTDVSTDDVFSALSVQHPELAALTRWGQQVTGAARQGGLFERDRFVTPDKIFEQFHVAFDAAQTDDVVSGILETTEALAFNKARIDCEDRDEEDFWNQVAEDLNLEERLREIWRELFIVSQCYVGVLWDRKSYRVRGKTTDGNKKRKEFKNMRVPAAMTILDPLKVVPVGNFLFGQERLVYVVDKVEGAAIDSVLAGRNTSDLAVSQLIDSRYEPDRTEASLITNYSGADTSNMFWLNPNRVFRITATRPDYMRFAEVRMKSVFELLDLKHQLRQMDRAHLIGGTNFIVLVKKGSDTMPAKQSEVNALAGQVRGAARVPVIVGDHRIEVEIITPKTDQTLEPTRYNGIDARITARLYQMFMTGNFAAGAKGDDSLKLARVVAKGMESRRQNIGRSLEDEIFTRAFKLNEKKLAERPVLNYIPRRISLEFDPNMTNFMLDLRDRGDVSRETLLGEVDINQEDEARKREREEEDGYDDIFKPTVVPFSGQPNGGGEDESEGNNSPTGTPQGDGRAGGGSSGGGGTNRRSGESGPGRGPARETST